MNTQFFRSFVLVFLTTMVAPGAEVVVHDADGTLSATRAPAMVVVNLSKRQRRAAVEERLEFREVGPASSTAAFTVPAQLLPTDNGSAAARVCWLMPPGPPGKRTFKLQELRQAADPEVIAKPDPASGQFDITDAGQAVLRYNYATIEPGETMTNVAPANRIYARARSDYIHPLFGFDGETLTQDWSVDHPHHRGIYWAWPEVDWRGQRGDLHALQKVFARPVGKCTVISGPVFAQIEAENIWRWESGESLVHERAIIRAYRGTGADRIVDLEFQFTALNEPVLLARRGTDKYGGLNLRLARVQDQEITFHTDPTNAMPRGAWAECFGTFGAARQPCGVVVLQHAANPDYPGEWVKFPELNWFQPTFPAGGKRYELKPGEPLVLRFRLWLHRGAKAGEENGAAHWRAYQAALAPAYFPKR